MYTNDKDYSAIKYESSDGTGRVFISYQKKSFDFVLRLSQYLEKNGVKTWYAPRNIKISGKWPEKLYEAISNCRALLLLYTDEADKSRHVMREVQIADSENKPIIWMRLDNSQPSKTLKYFLSLIQSIDYETGSKEEVEKLLLTILKKDPVNIEILKENTVQPYQCINNLEPVMWSKGILSFDNQDDAGECVARVYFEMAQKNPLRTVLLPTGRSARTVFYSMLRASSDYTKCPFGSAYLMNDTEIFGVNMNHATSRIKVINEYLITPLQNMGKAPQADQLKYFLGVSDSTDSEVATAEILKKYPPSVYGISISPYCEIIGYDLGKHSKSIVNDGPRLIEVNDESREYIDYRQKTNSIYTIGLGTALQSNLMMVLAFDKDKSNAVGRLFREDIDENVPLTLLRNHPNAYVIITKEVAKKAGLENFTINMTPLEAAKWIMDGQ